jgi:hypothetical protein
LCPKAATRKVSTSRWSGSAGTTNIELTYGGHVQGTGK